VTHLRKSTTALSLLETLCRNNEETYHSPQNDTPTRWSSTHTMIKNMLRMKKSLGMLFANDPKALSENEWQHLNEIALFLEPFAIATTKLSGQDYPTLGMAKFISDTLVEHVKKANTTHLLSFSQDARTAIRRVMLDKLGKYSLDMDKQSLLPTFFDLRYRDSLSPGILLDLVHVIAALLPVNAFSQVLRPPVDPFDSRMRGIQAERTPIPLDNLPPELKGYMECSRTDECPLSWWRRNGSKYPNLARMARNQLCILASSVPCEQIFSQAKDVITSKRNRLSPDHVQDLMLLKSFHHHIQSN